MGLCVCGHSYFRHWFVAWQGKHGCHDCAKCKGFQEVKPKDA